MPETSGSSGLELTTDGGSAEDAGAEFDSRPGVKRVKMKLRDLNYTEARPVFVCAVCSRRYRNRQALTHHMKMHQGLTTCPLCGKVLCIVAHLRRHLAQAHHLEPEQVLRQLRCAATHRVVPEKAGSDNNPSEAESEDISQIKSEPEDGNCDDPGVGNDTPDLNFLPEIKQEVVETATTSSPANAGLENVTPDLKMLIEVKEEVVPAATTSSSPANVADALPGSDCHSESVSQPGLKRADKRSVTTNARRFKCGLCYFSSKTSFNLEHHMKSHTGARPFHCDLCPAAGRQTCNLVEHRPWHTRRTEIPQVTQTTKTTQMTPITSRKTIHYCALCREEFALRAADQSHGETHAREKDFRRDSGPERLGCPTILKHHIIQKHSHKVKHRCEPCGKDFVSSVWLERHQASQAIDCCASGARCLRWSRNKSEQNPNPVVTETPDGHPETLARLSMSFVCTSCAAVLTCVDELAEHSQIHHPRSMTVSCELCSAELSWHWAVQHHKATHAKQKSYRGSARPDTFVDEDDLKHHALQKRMPNCRCERCGKWFVTLVSTEKHQATCSVGSASSDSLEPRAQLSRIETVSSESASADVFSTESSTGTQTCLDSTPPREDHATESVGAGQACADSVPVDSWISFPKVDEMPPSEEKFSVDPASEELSSDCIDRYPDESPWEDRFSVHSALDEQPSSDPLALD